MKLSGWRFFAQSLQNEINIIVYKYSPSLDQPAGGEHEDNQTHESDNDCDDEWNIV